MTRNIDVQRLERRAYLAYHNDGLWDLFLGVVFLGFGFMMIFDYVYLMGVLPAVMLPSMFSFKKSFTRPRLGYVKFSPERQARERRGRTGMQILLTLSVISGLLVWWAFTGDDGWKSWVRGLGLIPFGMVLSVLVAAAGLFFGIYRLVLYSFMILTVFILSHLANSHPAIYFLLPGATFTMVGIYKLVLFLRRYPKSGEGVTGGID